MNEKRNYINCTKNLLNGKLLSGVETNFVTNLLKHGTMRKPKKISPLRNLFLLFLLLAMQTHSFSQAALNWAFIPTSTSLFQNQITITATDQSGNIIEVGKLTGHADMDPGTGPNDTSYTRFFYNHYLSKTSVSGQLLWIYYFEDNSQLSTFEFKGLKITPTDEIIVAGNFTGKVDFDLRSPGVDTLRSHHTSFPDYFLAKYDASGNHQWAINGGNTTSGISAQALCLLPNSTILLSLNPSGITDVDPGGLVHTTIGNSANLVAYSQTGSYLWNNAIPSNFTYAVSFNSMDADAMGNSYLLSVGSYELTVAKFNANGTFLWEKTIGNFSTGARVNPQSILVDKISGGFYLAGTFEGNVDFDPNAGVLNYTCLSALNPDAFVASYDTSMTPMWLNHYVGKVNFGNYGLDFDGNELVCVGNYTASVNFGNGFNFTTASTYSPFYLRLNSSGTALDAFTLNGIGQFTGISKTINHTFVITGNILAWVDMDPSLTISNLHAGTANFFTAVYHITSPTSLPKLNNKPQPAYAAFPNPFGQELNLEFLTQINDAELKIYDICGKEMATNKLENFTDRFTINTSSWPEGVYFVCFKTPATTSNFKLVKQ